MPTHDLTWFKFYPNDFFGAEAVLALSDSAALAYLRLLSYQFDKGSVCDDPRILSRVLVKPEEEALNLWEALLDQGLFLKNDEGRYVNPRMQTVREEALRNHKARVKGGHAAARAKRQLSTSTAPAVRAVRASHSHSHSHSPDSHPSNNSTEGGVGGDTDPPAPAKPAKPSKPPRPLALWRQEFDERFWPACPVKQNKAKARKAFLRAREEADLDTILAGLPTYARYEAERRAADPQGYRPLHPATWLNGERWTDSLDIETPKPDYSDWDNPTQEESA